MDENLCSSVVICRFWLYASTSNDYGRGVKCAVRQYLQITWFLGMNLCLFWTSHKLLRIYLVSYARIQTLESSYHCLILERNTGVSNSLCFLLPLLLLQPSLVALICSCFFLQPQKFIHSFIKYLLSVCYVPGTTLVENSVMNSPQPQGNSYSNRKINQYTR